MPLDFELTEDQRAMQDLAREFARNEIMPVAAEHDREGRWPKEIVEKAHTVGLMNVAVPAEFGGAGLGVLDEAIITEELGYGCLGITLNFMISNLAATPVKLAGSKDQKERFLRPLAEKAVLASYAVTEPGAGSDVAGMQSTAVKKGDRYILNGTKQWITGGGHAIWFVVFAYTDKTNRHTGMSAFLVPRETKGVKVGKKEDMMGQRASDTRQIVFEDVEVPEENRLGAEGEGFSVAMRTFNRSRPPISCGAIGLARRALDEATAYARERVAFGKKIGEFQIIQGMLAEMDRDIEAGRLLAYKAAWMADHGMDSRREAAIAKLFCADAAMRITTEAVQILGGNGYSKEYPVEKLMRDAKVTQIYEGTSQVQRLIIARQLLGVKG